MQVVVLKVIPLVLLLFANTVEIGSQRRSVSFFKLTHLLVDALGTHTERWRLGTCVSVLNIKYFGNVYSDNLDIY